MLRSSSSSCIILSKLLCACVYVNRRSSKVASRSKSSVSESSSESESVVCERLDVVEFDGMREAMSSKSFEGSPTADT